MERVVDALFRYVNKYDVEHVFMVTGGGAMFINDAVDKNSNLEAVYLHHEQSCAMAAVAYGKHEERLFGCCVTTSGCGVTNAMTGLLDAWQDGIPVLFISGNSNSNQIHNNHERHYGVQDLDLEPIVSPLTKWFYRVHEESDILWVVHEAYRRMMTGNPGPVWIDIPIDIQGKKIPEKHFSWKNGFEFENATSLPFSPVHVKGSRPLILIGQGLSSYEASILVDQFPDNVPVVTTFGGTNAAREIEKSRCLGTIGVKGNRLSNLALFYADTIIAAGTSLSIPAIGYNFDDSLKHCKNLYIIDKDLEKHRKRLKDCKFNKFYFDNVENFEPASINCKDWIKTLTSLSLPGEEDQSAGDRVDLEKVVPELLDVFYDSFGSNSQVVSDAGSAYYVVSKNMYKYTNFYNAPISQAEMGASIPYAVGAHHAIQDDPVLAFTGDGSLQMNIQDLGSIKNSQITLVVLDNEGYVSIRNTQNKFFGGKYYGTDTKSGLEFPDLDKICEAYDVEYVKKNKGFTKEDFSGGKVIHVSCIREQEIWPRVEAKKLEDGSFKSYGFVNMFPFLSEEELEDIESRIL